MFWTHQLFYYFPRAEKQIERFGHINCSTFSRAEKPIERFGHISCSTFPRAEKPIERFGHISCSTFPRAEKQIERFGHINCSTFPRAEKQIERFGHINCSTFPRAEKQIERFGHINCSTFPRAEKQIERFGHINCSTFPRAEKQIERFVTQWPKSGRLLFSFPTTRKSRSNVLDGTIFLLSCFPKSGCNVFINSGLKMDKSVLRLKKSGLNDLINLLPYPQNNGRILPKTHARIVCQNRRWK